MACYKDIYESWGKNPSQFWDLQSNDIDWIRKPKKILDDNAGKQIRANFNIANRDEFVWTKVRDRHATADVNVLNDFIKSF